ncbi:MAG: RidA family protein [Chitinophagaceae bacterium]
MAHTIEEKLKQCNITLPEATPPVASYVNMVQSGNLLFLSGKGPVRQDGTAICGKLGKEISIAEGQQAAWLAAIQHLAVLKAELGSLEKVKRIVKVFGLVNSVPDFIDQPQVINGYSNLMAEIFADKGKHARSAVGVNALPMNWAVEVELIVEIKEEKK